jgi:serine/threonine-protein kinase
MNFEMDARADVWGLGTTLFRSLSGRPPFKNTAELVAYVYGTSPLPAPSAQVPKVVALILQRSLAVEPGDRFETAAALRDALEGAMAAEGAPATHVDVERYLSALTRREPDTEPYSPIDIGETEQELPEGATQTGTVRFPKEK